MAGSSVTFHHGLRQAISAPFHVAMFFGAGALIIVVGRIIIDLIFTGTDPHGIAAAQSALIADIMLTQKLPDVGGPATERAIRWAMFAYEWLYLKTGIDQTLIAPNITEIEQAFRRGLSVAEAKPHWQAAIIGIEALAVRASMIQTMLPTLCLTYTIAAIDGWIARWIRRESGGRESSTIYHRAKYFHAIGVTLFMMAWFWYPKGFDFWTATIAMAVVGGVLLRTQLMYYKKYV